MYVGWQPRRFITRRGRGQQANRSAWSDCGEPLPWQRRTITLIADRAETERLCAGWEQEGWLVMTIDETTPTVSGHATHTVRVAVPPVGWQPHSGATAAHGD